MTVALILYIVVYTALSFHGQYVYSQSGKIRNSITGLSMHDLTEWRPLGCWFQAGFIDVDGGRGFRGNALGYFFAPLILMDQKWVHKTVELRGESNFLRMEDY